MRINTAIGKGIKEPQYKWIILNPLFLLLRSLLSIIHIIVFLYPKTLIFFGGPSFVLLSPFGFCSQSPLGARLVTERYRADCAMFTLLWSGENWDKLEGACLIKECQMQTFNKHPTGSENLLGNFWILTFQVIFSKVWNYHCCANYFQIYIIKVVLS